MEKDLQDHNMLQEIVKVHRQLKELMEKYPSIIAIDKHSVLMEYTPYLLDCDETICFRYVFGEGKAEELNEKYIRHETVALGLKFVALEERNMSEKKEVNE